MTEACLVDAGNTMLGSLVRSQVGRDIEVLAGLEDAQRVIVDALGLLHGRGTIISLALPGAIDDGSSRMPASYEMCRRLRSIEYGFFALACTGMPLAARWRISSK